MGYLNNFMMKTKFNFKNMSSFNVFLFQNFVPFGGLLFVSISALFFTLFDFFSEAFSWIQSDEISELDKSIPIETEDVREEKTEETETEDVREEETEDTETEDVREEKTEETETENVREEKTEETETEDVRKESESIEEDETPKLFFKFQFQTKTFEEFSKKFEENENYNVGLDSIPLIPFTSTNKYEFNSGNDLSCIIEKPQESSFSVKELYADSTNGLSSEQDFIEQNPKDSSENEVETEKMKLVDSSRDIEEQENGSSNASDDSEKSNLETPLTGSDCEESNGLETLWEHQELIEQLKMELKKVKATGLPTILEESESPIKMDDLKPWKIDEKFQYADRMSELHKFYKSYRERMRKFDILNYQKMYAIGFLHSKDPFQSISSHKSSSSPSISSLLPQNLRPRRRETSDSDPMSKFINELHGDMEMVYVGQLCLSWEILHWQYEKAIEIWESDPHCTRRYKYNEVAGEFQQFQVLIQRFIENEPFEGPRVQNYIKNRCVLRNLLQVPVIREDRLKDKKKGRRKGGCDDDDDAITADMLLEIIEESIRIFWRFLRADKDSNIVVRKIRKGTQVEPLEPDELQLLATVQTSLQKKEKRLKDVLRSGSCILRKLKKNEEENNSDQVLYFFSQVDLKLVARVLNMSRVTKDQLFWCHGKLSKINFVNRKINIEPSFLLFPC